MRVRRCPRVVQTYVNPVTSIRWVMMVLALVASLSPRLAPAQTNTPSHFEDAACPFTLSSGVLVGQDVRCGYLVVPEDRSVAHGRTIKLAVAIFKSSKLQTAADPVIWLQGGPGGSALGVAKHIDLQNVATLTGNRDLILVDQRGTGYSQPSLDCPESTTEQAQALAKGWSKAKEDTKEAASVRACRSRLVQAGVNLSAYNTDTNAADIADLRVALGYSSVNLYGASYGTRLGLAVIRSYPQGIRSVVLDAVLPPTVNAVSAPGFSAARDFNLLFSACGKSRTCASSHPHLRAVLATLIRRLDKKPPIIKVIVPGTQRTVKVVLTGETFVSILFSALYRTSLITILPEMVTRAAHGSYALTARVASNAGAVGNQGISIGMFLSVECAEDAPFTTSQAVDAAAQGLPNAVLADFVAQSHRELHDCRVWDVPTRGAVDRQPVVSSIPTLLMVGEFDPITPPPYAEAVSKTLGHGYLVTYPGMGHGTRFSDRCPYNMAAAFLDDPARRPDDSCVASMSEPFLG